MTRLMQVCFAGVLMLAPLGAWAADLVVWWQKGAYPQEDEALTEIVTAFEHESGKQVEVSFYDELELPVRIEAALEAGQPPDIAYGLEVPNHAGQWAHDDRLADLTDTIGGFSNLFDPDTLDHVAAFDAKTGRKALYGLPFGRSSYHIHVWKDLLGRAGFKLDDIPREWEAFWSFWCDQVQPAVRRATGRDDVWGVGVPMSVDAFETWFNLRHFMTVYGADYVTPDGRLVIDDAEIRQKLAKAIDSYTTIYRGGCTPPDAVTWDGYGNNEAFLARKVVMTINETLSVVNALKSERPDDYYHNSATIEWPLGLHGDDFAIGGIVYFAVVFKSGNVATAKEFVQFLLGEGWLAHYLDFSGERILPSMSKLLESPFWLDPSDPHHMAAVMQVASRPLMYDYAAASGDWRHELVVARDVWEMAVHDAATGKLSPEQAVDEAIARIKQILAD
jgi:multiple sugar transport system substrate-binding protein